MYEKSQDIEFIAQMVNQSVEYVQNVLNDKLPSKEERKQIILNNFEVVKKMQKMFLQGTNCILSKFEE